MAISADAGKVGSRRSRYTRLPPSSTTAIEPPSLLRRASAAAAAATALAPSRLIVFLSVTWPPWPPWPRARPAATVSITAASVNVFHVDMVVLLPFASVLCHLAEHLDHALAVLEVVEQLPVVLEPLHRVRQQPIEPSRILEGRLRQILHTRLEILAVRVHRPHHDLVAEHE